MKLIYDYIVINNNNNDNNDNINIYICRKIKLLQEFKNYIENIVNYEFLGQSIFYKYILRTLIYEGKGMNKMKIYEIMPGIFRGLECYECYESYIDFYNFHF